MSSLHGATATLNALRRAADEHGAPNSFAPSELHAFHGAPAPMRQGHLARSLAGRTFLGLRIGYEGRRWTAEPA